MTTLGPSNPNTTYRRNIEGNDEVSSLQGRNINEKSGLWEDDRAWVRIPSRLLHIALSLLLSLNYRTLHCVCFVTVSIICGAIVWATGRSSSPIPYVDALFLCTSAMTGAGLRTVELSTLSPFQQSVIFILLVIGHKVFLSLSVPLIRRRSFDKKIRAVAGQSKHRFQGESSLKMERGDDSSTEPLKPDQDNTDFDREDKSQWVDDDDDMFGNLSRRKVHDHHRVFPMVGLGARPDLRNHPRDGPSRPDAGYVQKKLGGVEYLALKFLAMLIMVYWLTCLFFGVLAIGFWLKARHPGLAASNNGVSPFWTGAFLAVSAFVNSGMSLQDTSMVPFREDTYLLLVLGLLVLAGNTLYPCLLRFIVWTLRKILPGTPSWATWGVTLDFILEHPRKLYTHIFPSRHTWYLAATVIILNGIQWISFETLSLRNREVQSIPLGYRILNGLFQSVSIRFGGFHTVFFGDLTQGLLILYGLMMLIPPHPVLITMRSTNVYEERPVAIYDDNDRSDPVSGILHTLPSSSFTQRRVHTARYQSLRAKSSRGNFIRLQLSHRFGSDLLWIALGTMAISIAEHDHYTQDPVAFSTINILFEVLSGYGGSGVSVGGPGVRHFSFCGSWHPISKVILGILILKGRHHRLPRAIDKAVMLPNESVAWAEEEDAACRQERNRALGSSKMPVGCV
ncbi:hypothetical protein AbraIFM66950_003576 [Aspergillus brasiliensis]|nr:hypothetical protein AbraIFM66950_003576 [Aspergillus brasiliensis]